MSYHILHLLSHNLKVRIKLGQLHVTDLDSGTDKSVPLADVAVIVCAARDTEFSASSLRRMAELNVLLLICNEKFEPCAITLPYYRATNTEWGRMIIMRSQQKADAEKMPAQMQFF
jgi:CRISPR/Cas system-associated endonuclease Cas1